MPRKVLRLVEARGIGDLVAGQLGSAMGRLHGIDPAMAPPDLPGDLESEPAVVMLEQMREGVAALLPTGWCSSAHCPG